jgi:N-acylneuraminate cytidylyltransferase
VVSVVVVLLGNTAMVSPKCIDDSITMLEEDPRATAVMTVWRAQDDHPYRALAPGADGYLVPFFMELGTTSSNRQTYPPAYYYDNGPWAIRKSCLLNSHNRGPSPWWWCGRRLLPLEREWVTGRDVHSPFDVEVAEWWLMREKARNKRETNAN